MERPSINGVFGALPIRSPHRVVGPTSSLARIVCQMVLNHQRQFSRDAFAMFASRLLTRRTPKWSSIGVTESQAAATRPRQMKSIFHLLIAYSIAVASPHVVVAGPVESATDVVEFNRDIRPILSDTCFKCHGPDQNQRVSELRLDTKEGALADLGGFRAIVPGDLETSELYRRITTDNPDELMPPPKSGRELSDEQIALLTRWIQQGAEWEDHWSFIAPQRPTLPETKNRTWRKNGIDDFVLARLQREGLHPSPEADKPTLIRRVTLDLIGLPATVEEVDAFLADDSTEAYERVVDRLLHSPRYGERMALVWLDAARYADTSGYQTDGPRYMWRWRDWVIDALNDNMPFDEFTIEQLAGDLLAFRDGAADRRSTTAWRGELFRDAVQLDHLIASGFNRNHRGNAEGGIITEEYEVEYVVDRVDTTFTVWLGMTIGCSRCHDHKYDPLRQQEFYKVFAFFNNIPEYGRAIKEGNSPPYIKAPTPDQLKRLGELDNELAAAEEQVKNVTEDVSRLLTDWEPSFAATQSVDWTVTDGLQAHLQLDGNIADGISDKRGGKFASVGGAFVEGRLDQAAQLSGECFIEAGDVGKFGYFDKFTLAAWVHPQAPSGTILSRMIPTPQAGGYYVVLEDGHIQVNLVSRWLDDSLRVQTHRQLPLHEWHHVTVTYDGSRVPEAIKIYVDGQLQPLKVNWSFINQTFELKEPFRIGGGNGNFNGAIDDVRIYDRDLSPEEVTLVATPESISEILTTAAEERTDSQQLKLRTYFINEQAPKPIRLAHERLVSVRRERRAFFEDLPTLMVMQELPEPRDTHVLVRGEYDNPGDKVSAGVPAILPPLPADARQDRLGFANWLMDPANPLTARVTVNRFWQMYFGTGLVKTTEDFGAQGELPSHPKLLDWLATEFIRVGWDMKAIQKLIVMSATYRQASKVAPELLARDPENRLLARASRLRLPAETVRDQALAIGGLLTEKSGGPSVLPYQPEGLWEEIATDKVYNQSHGDDLYRRSLYTFWKRTVAPPTMVTLDATAREACTVKRSRTNTPLQALVLMNETAFFEAARALAQLSMTQAGQGVETRIRYAFRRATSRQPRTAELQVLTDSFHHYLDQYRQDPASAEKLLSVGEFPRDEQLDAGALASYTMVASLILNLDELITKE